MSEEIRALEARHDVLVGELDTLVRSNQNRRGVLIVESTKVHVAPFLIALAIIGLLGAATALVWPAKAPPPPPTDCR